MALCVDITPPSFYVQATVEISSRYDGVITKVHYEVGSMVNVGAALVDIEIVDEGLGPQVTLAPSSTPAAASAPAAAAPLAAGKPSNEVRALLRTSDYWHFSLTPPIAAPLFKVLTTPAVRKIARESDLDLTLIAPTGPHGRILKSDVLNYIAAGGNVAAAPAASATVAAPSAAKPAAAAPVATLPSRGSGAAAESTTVLISGAALQQWLVCALKRFWFITSRQPTFCASCSLRHSAHDG